MITLPLSTTEWALRGGGLELSAVGASALESVTTLSDCDIVENL